MSKIFEILKIEKGSKTVFKPTYKLVFMHSDKEPLFVRLLPNGNEFALYQEHEQELPEMAEWTLNSELELCCNSVPRYDVVMVHLVLDAHELLSEYKNAQPPAEFGMIPMRQVRANRRTEAPTRRMRKITPDMERQ